MGPTLAGVRLVEDIIRQLPWRRGLRLAGWGGLYVLTASAVEVEFLGYSRFGGVLRPSAADPGAAADEEAHV